MGRHEGKVAFVTGGSSGMGLATARLLLTEGAKVVIVANDKERLEKAVHDLDRGDDVLAISADFSGVDAISSALEQVYHAFGRIDILFANAGIGLFKPVDQITETDFDKIVDLNFKGLFFTVQKALPVLNERASVILNASWTLHRALPLSTVYSASKAAVHNLARTFATALAPRGIRVNSISPGFINTAQFNETKIGEEQARSSNAHVPLGRFGTVDEVAKVVSFLASDDAVYITGQDYLIDGGMVTAFLP